MPSPNAISADKLARLLGRPDSPSLIDVRTEEDFGADPRLVPGAVRRASGAGGALRVGEYAVRLRFEAARGGDLFCPAGWL